MRERLTVQKPIAFTASMAEKIRAEASRLGVSFAEIVRDCVEHDLTNLKARNRNRILKRGEAEQNSD